MPTPLGSCGSDMPDWGESDSAVESEPAFPNDTCCFCRQGLSDVDETGCGAVTCHID